MSYHDSDAHLLCACGGHLKAVVDSRLRFEGQSRTVYRRRLCVVCGKRSTNFEMTEADLEALRQSVPAYILARPKVREAILEVLKEGAL